MFMVMSGSAFKEQQEGIRKFIELAEKHGVKVDSADIKKMLKFAEYIGMDVEAAMRTLVGEQGLTPEQRKKIRYLFALEFGKVETRVPRSVLEPEELPEPPELGLEKCSEQIYIDGLGDRKTGIVYFAINHMDIQVKYVLPSRYDFAMDEPRGEINYFLAEFFRHKSKSLVLHESEGISFDTRLGPECPPFRTYEMELIEVETESLRYALRYGQGKVLFKKGNLPFDRFVETLKRVGKWEQ
jgi:hypothetical protein